MNVIISNEQQSKIATLDIDVIKSITGIFGANEIVEMFKNFFYSKMVLDVTAIKGYTDVQMFKVLAEGLDPDKTIYFIPEGNSICTPQFLAQLISLGIFNFTTNTEGVKYLIKKSNTYNDVANIHQMGGGGPIPQSPVPVNPNDYNETGAVQVQVQPAKVEQVDEIVVVEPKENVVNTTLKIGVRNITDHAGSSSLIYMMKKELVSVFGDNKVIAIEINKNDFQYYNDKAMISSNTNELRSLIEKYNGVTPIILIDLNDFDDNTVCDEIIYLMEASTLKLNKLIRKNKSIFQKLKDKKIVLNKNLLSDKDIEELEYEAGIKFYYSLPPLNDRKRNDIVNEFLSKLGLVHYGTEAAGKIFGLFRR